MTDKVVLVTEPDDIQIDGCRILLVDLTDDQNQFVSKALNLISNGNSLVIYVANHSNIDWILDKKNKSQLIIFNADSDNHLLQGYLAAQKISHYFGNLKILSEANNRVIYTVDDLVNLIEKTIGTYERNSI
jgi:hypothetical protein